MTQQAEQEPTRLSFESAFLGFQHMLASFGGILTAPLIIAMGMGLSLQETSYLVSSSLVVSGLATFIQIVRVGPIGSGLLSIQGTSFAFVGPFIYAYETMAQHLLPSEALGTLFGSAATCAAAVFVLSYFVKSLRTIITTNVSGTTLILIGISLIVITLQNIHLAYQEMGSMGWQVLAIAGGVFVSVLGCSFFGLRLLKIASVAIGLAVGLIMAMFFGLVDWVLMEKADAIFVLDPLRHGWQLDWTVVMVLFPIFLVSATESVGDFTATNALSHYRYGDTAFWTRIRGGLMGDALNSFLASVFCSFPNTTFSQNNGVIRLTGAYQPTIGLYAAGFLVLLGSVPIISSLFQAIPAVVVFGAALLLFIMVAVAGIQLVLSGGFAVRSGVIVALSVTGGYIVSEWVPQVELMPQGLQTVLGFPVSTGAFIAVLLELVWPSHGQDQ